MDRFQIANIERSERSKIFRFLGSHFLKWEVYIKWHRRANRVGVRLGIIVCKKRNKIAMRLFGWLVLSVLSLLNRLLVSSSKTPTLSFWIIRAFQQQQVNDNDANDFDSAGRESQHAWNLFGRIDERTDQYVIQ